MGWVLTIGFSVFGFSLAATLFVEALAIYRDARNIKRWGR